MRRRGQVGFQSRTLTLHAQTNTLCMHKVYLLTRAGPDLVLHCPPPPDDTLFSKQEWQPRGHSHPAPVLLRPVPSGTSSIEASPIRAAISPTGTRMLPLVDARLREPWCTPPNH
jgi:hypothetical protein